MAKYLDKDPEVYARERDGFLRDLKHFHETRGTPFRRAPKLTGHPIDLYLLYSLVTGRGGWIKVNYRNQWSELFEALEIPICVNASIALKQIYLRYLDRWEKVHYLGEEADRGSDDDEESRHKRWSARALHSVPLSYNYNQHCVTEATREYNNLSTNIYKKSDYDRLALSLISPLPNEQDFAINVCTLLSNDGKHTLKLEKHARILDYLLAHAGVFTHGSLRRLFMHCYISARKQAIHNFWRDALITVDYLDLTIEPNSNATFSHYTPKNHLNNCPNTTAGTSCRSTNNSTSRKSNNGKDFNDNTRRTQVQHSDYVSETIKNNACSSSGSSLKFGASSVTLGSFRDSGQQERMLAVRDNDGDDDDDVTIFGPDYPDIEDCLLMIDGSDGLEDVPDSSECKRRKWERSETDRILFNLGRSLGTRDYMGQRVLQIATILRNLSFIEENIPTLSNNRSFLRFMLLCTASRWNQLQNLGLDMLGNVAGEILVRDINTDRLPAVLLKLICDGLQTEDRHWCISALEVLNKLSQNAKNEDTLLRVLEPEVYKRVCSFLTIHDVMLLIYTLECLYSLSSLGERSCNLIVSNFGVVDTLVSLVTVEGKSYGPKACIGMKLVETVTGTVQQQQQTPTQQVLTSSISPPPITINSSQQQLSVNATANVASTICATSPHTISAPAATPVSISGVTTGPNGSTFSSPVKATTLGAVVVTATTAKSVGVSPMNQELLNVATVAATSPAISSPHPLISKPSPSSKRSLSPLSTTTTTSSTSSNPFAQQLSSVNAASPIITAQQLVQQQHAHQQAIQENEQFALTWLRTTYEPCAILGNARVDSQELYKHYINSCQRIGRRGVIAPLHFPRCVRSVFGGTVGPNPAKPPGSSDAQFYDGIKVKSHPHLSQALMSASSTSSSSNTGSTTTLNSVSASSTGSVVSTSKGTSTALSAVESSSGQNQGSSSTSLIKSLLATKVNNNNGSVTNERMQATEPQVVSPQVAARQQQQRLLAQQNQLDDTSQPKKTQSISLKRSFPASNSRLNGARQLFPPNSTDPPITQDTISSSTISSSSVVVQSSVTSVQHTTVSSSRREPPQPPPLTALGGGGGIANNHSTLRRLDLLQQQQRAPLENEDSDSIGNNSMASSTGPAGVGCVSSTEDGESSLASFDGLINGIPSVDRDTIILNEDSDDSDGDDRGERSHVVIKKPLMLADLLEKKVEREPPIINGILSKELRIGDKGLQLVENHIDKVLSAMDSSDSSSVSGPIIDQVDGASDEPDAPSKFSKGKAKKRTSEEELSEAEPTKKMLLSQSQAGTSRNRIATRTSPPIIDNSSNSTDNEDLNSATVSTAAAKLFADMAADILEDENDDDENEVIPAAPREPINQQQSVNAELVDSSQPTTACANQVVTPRHIQQSTTIPSLQTQQQQQQVIVQGNPARQIIVSQAPSTVATCSGVINAGGMMLAPGTQLKTQSGQTVIVQNMQNTQVQQHARPQQVIMQQGPSSQILLSQTATNQLGQLGQMQLVATGQSGGQPTQYVIQTTGGSGAQNFVVAQPQTAVVHGQQQTVLVAQTGQQVGGQGGKTIIILQPTQVQQMQQQLQQVQQVQQHVQKVVMGPLGQQMVVTTPVTRSSTINTTQGTITLTAAPQAQATPTIITAHQTQAILPQPTTIIQTVQAQTNNGPANNVQVQQKVVHQIQTTNVANDSCNGANVLLKSAVNKQTNVVSAGVTMTSAPPLVTTVAVACKSTPAKKKSQFAAAKDALFICEWANCQVEMVFKSANQVFMHVCEEHCKETASGTEELLCEWDRCDNMKRKRFSLMTHLQDKHCNLEAMKASLTKRKQSAQSGKSEPIVQSPPSQQHPGYAPDAAFHAIKRHALEFVNPKELQDDNEGPVTKSIRLTASLILRNLVIYSTNCRRLLKPYEPHLANVALSNVESSRTIAQVLYDMNDSHHHHISSSSSRKTISFFVYLNNV